MHYFDLTRVYSGNDLILAQILFSLFAVITFALERKLGSIGYLSGRQIRVLCLVLLDVFHALYGILPSARYVHYLVKSVSPFHSNFQCILHAVPVLTPSPTDDAHGSIEGLFGRARAGSS